jgi:hypothetical protein
VSLGDKVYVPATVRLDGLSVRLHLHSVWARIAIDQAQEAMRATPASEEEFNCGLVAVTCAAFALESLKALLVEGHRAGEAASGPLPTEGRNAGNFVVGTVEAALHVSLASCAADVVDVFTLRNLAVHHEPKYKDPGWHPSGVGVPVEQAAFRADVARDAARTLLAVYVACASSTTIPEVAQETAQLVSSLRARAPHVL